MYLCMYFVCLKPISSRMDGPFWFEPNKQTKMCYSQYEQVDTFLIGFGPICFSCRISGQIIRYALPDNQANLSGYPAKPNFNLDVNWPNLRSLTILLSLLAVEMEAGTSPHRNREANNSN